MTVIPPTVEFVPLEHQPKALVDAADLEAVLAAGPWHFAICSGKFYAQHFIPETGQRPRVERLHTFLTGWPLVDHINGDGLDNRRANLRPATASQNAANTRTGRRSRSGFRGVYWHKQSQRWAARITVDGVDRSLRYHPTAEAAARAYDDAAREAFGEFAVLNFPSQQGEHPHV